MSVWDSLDAKMLKAPKDVDFGPIVEPPAKPVDIPQEEGAEPTPDITIGGGALGTEQKMMKDQKMLDQLDDQQYQGQRKSNLI